MDKNKIYSHVMAKYTFLSIRRFICSVLNIKIILKIQIKAIFIGLNWTLSGKALLNGILLSKLSFLFSLFFPKLLSS